MPPSLLSSSLLSSSSLPSPVNPSPLVTVEMQVMEATITTTITKEVETPAVTGQHLMSSEEVDAQVKQYPPSA